MERKYFVMTRSSMQWIRISPDFSQRDDAENALRNLRRIYPSARLGANCESQLNTHSDASRKPQADL